MKLNYSFDKYKIIFTLFVISYAILYSLDGFDDADRGYTLALSWRIFNGEIPYRDIILVRPPFSPLFHSIFLYFIKISVIPLLTTKIFSCRTFKISIILFLEKLETVIILLLFLAAFLYNILKYQVIYHLFVPLQSQHPKSCIALIEFLLKKKNGAGKAGNK